MEFVKNDGGRLEAGYKGSSGDCVLRSICIASGLGYQETHDRLWKIMEKDYEKKRRNVKRLRNTLKKRGLNYKPRGPSHDARHGVYRKHYGVLFKELGWDFQPINGSWEDLPDDDIIIAVTARHLAAVINGVLQDAWDCTRNKNVIGYWYLNIPER